MEIVVLCLIGYAAYRFFYKNQKTAVTAEVIRKLDAAAKKLPFVEFEGDRNQFAYDNVSFYWSSLESFLKDKGAKIRPVFSAMLILRRIAARLHSEEQEKKAHNPNTEFVLMALSLAIMECQSKSAATGNPMEVFACSEAMRVMQMLTAVRHVEGMEFL